MTRRWRLILSGASDPFTNMALDETLLRSYPIRDSGPTFRIYGWEPAALSLGVAQDPRRELDLEACRRAALPFVRRITGGGIIRHDGELTYSLVASKEDLGIPGGIAHSYKAIAAFLIEFYRRLGLEASYACDEAPDVAPAAPDVAPAALAAAPGEARGGTCALCFAAREKYDIVIGGRKIGGSAQKRTRGLIFQHGSIPLCPPPSGTDSFLRDPALAGRAAARSTDLAGLLGRRACPTAGVAHPGRQAGADELSGLLIESFQSTFGVTLERGGLSAGEEALMDDLRVRKYGSREWNLDRVDCTTITEPSLLVKA